MDTGYRLRSSRRCPSSSRQGGGEGFWVGAIPIGPFEPLCRNFGDISSDFPSNVLPIFGCVFFIVISLKDKCELEIGEFASDGLGHFAILARRRTSCNDSHESRLKGSNRHIVLNQGAVGISSFFQVLVQIRSFVWIARFGSVNETNISTCAFNPYIVRFPRKSRNFCKSFTPKQRQTVTQCVGGMPSLASSLLEDLADTYNLWLLKRCISLTMGKDRWHCVFSSSSSHGTMQQQK